VSENSRRDEKTLATAAQTIDRNETTPGARKSARLFISSKKGSTELKNWELFTF
jgi:hypothetical protein